ncbi:hypothetical protein L6164_009195 [Bauhinia variegata]|uniref:Uncharacterized protein n=1 Tax=Bauhinia variegata TaxID=167791 RepID=A0ACB9PKJ2_BAUVA|nr:hypothetical protein L6164_009195 [Bauhinia variegata]
MASVGVAFLAISMVLLSSVAIAVDHIVGDENGWTLEFNYRKWAFSKLEITFVRRKGFDPLDTLGKKWYICRVSDQCSRGMKLVIDVQSAPKSAARSLVSSIYGVFTAAIVAVAAIFM